MPGILPVSALRLRARFPVALAALLLACGPASGQLRVVNYNSASLNGDQAALQSVFESLNADDRPGFALPPHLYVFQEVRSDEVGVLHDLLNAAAPPDVSYSMGTYTNHNENGFAGAQAMFFRDDVLQEIADEHVDLPTGAGREADRWKLKLAGYDSPDACFYIYSAHLKASQGSSNEQIRLEGVLVIRADADSLPEGAHIIYAGDMNFYDNEEPGYLAFLSPGAAQAVDPLGSGSWAGPQHAIKHSQSPRVIAEGGLIGGGLDDRFDFQLTTGAVQDGAGLSLIEGTCRSLGNDGNHYDLAINDGDNTYYADDIARSNALADALHEASDHVPVVVDYQIPAVMDADMPDALGRIIQGAACGIDLTVRNVVNVIVPAGGDALDYAVTADGGLVGEAEGTIEALGPEHVINLALDTSLAGPWQGSALVTSDSEGAQNDLIELLAAGDIVRPANPSFSAATDVDDLTIDWALQADTGLQLREVEIFNFAFDELQALLDIDAAEGVTGPFQFIGGLDSGIGQDPAVLTFAFETDGASPGQYEAAITIVTSDEDIPGEEVSPLALTLAVTVSTSGDVNGDGEVNVIDLLALLAAWGDCPDPPDPCPADLDGNGAVNTSDLLTLLANWGRAAPPPATDHHRL